MKKRIIIFGILMFLCIISSLVSNVKVNEYNIKLDNKGDLSNIYYAEYIDNMVLDLETKINVNNSEINELTNMIITNTNNINNLNENVGSMENIISTNETSIANIQTSLSSYATISELSDVNNYINSVTNITTLNSQGIFDLQNNATIKDSAVHSYIKADGTYGNIEYDIQSVKSAIPNVLTTTITDYSEYTLAECVVLIHQNKLGAHQSISANVQFSDAAGNKNSFYILGTKVSSTRGKYIVMGRSDNEVYIFRMISNSTYSRVQLESTDV